MEKQIREVRVDLPPGYYRQPPKLASGPFAGYPRVHVEIDIWKKDDLKIEFLKVYRSGWIIVDQLPNLSGYNPDEGINIFEEFEFDEHQLHDGSEETSIFPKELPAEECERLLALSEEELADEGWTLAACRTEV